MFDTDRRLISRNLKVGLTLTQKFGNWKFFSAHLSSILLVGLKNFPPNDGAGGDN